MITGAWALAARRRPAMAGAGARGRVTPWEQRMSLGAAVLEVVAECVLPTLISEVSGHAVRHAARELTRRASPPALATATPSLHPVSASSVLSHTPGRVRLRVA